MKNHYIYCICHISKNKYYIGETNDYIKRFDYHMKRGERGYDTIDRVYKKRGLYLAMHKYGITDFAFRILEICNYEERYQREAYWICKFNSHKENGFNSIVGINGVALQTMRENPKLNYLTTDDIKKILSRKNNIPYIEASNHIDEDLIDYGIYLKNNVSKQKHNQVMQKNTDQKCTDKCKSGFTNIYILQDKLRNKLYIGNSQHNSNNKILENILGRAKNDKSIRSSNGLYTYLNSMPSHNNISVNIVKNNIKIETITDEYKYELMIKEGFCTKDLISDTQKEIFKKIEKMSSFLSE